MPDVFQSHQTCKIIEQIRKSLLQQSYLEYCPQFPAHLQTTIIKYDSSRLKKKK